MIDAYLRELTAELDGVDVRGRAARRLLAEARDHLLEGVAAAGGEEAAVRRFGDPGALARVVAAELATARARAAAYGTFAALALAGLSFGASLLLVPAAGGWQDVFAGRFGSVSPLLAIALLVLPQVSFVAGCLALVRALRLRRETALPQAELRLLRRRTTVALATGGGTLAALAAYGLDFRGELAGWWTWTTMAVSLALLGPLAGAAVGVARSARPAASTEGRAEDLFDDLRPLFRLEPVRRLDLSGHPWRFAFLSAALVGTAGFAGGWYAEGDPGSGLVRGAFEAVALMGCFAVLGRYLGLRRSTPE